jgi:hypothetical protein
MPYLTGSAFMQINIQARELDLIAALNQEDTCAIGMNARPNCES